MRAVARDLAVDPDSLQASIDLRAPHPSVEVLLAVIGRHGVDPMWLLTGEYDLATHREALENPSSAAALLARTSLRRERSLGAHLDEIELDGDVSGGRLSPALELPEREPPEQGDQAAAP